MTSLTLKNIQKSYDDVPVLHHIDLEIQSGEFLVVVGPSGCGKSTFLRLLAGLEDVSAGSIHLNDRDITHLPSKSRDMAMVFQNYALYPHMTVFENMAYGLKIRRRPKKEILQRVHEAADMLDLRHLLSRKPRALSGGQRQRVAMGRALVRHPAVFLFDEPLSNLDAKLRVDTRVQIHKLQRRLGITSVYVTHDQVEAMTLADRLLVLNQGYVEQIGTPLELYHQPKTKFVAGFMGSPSMNFIVADYREKQLYFPSGLSRPSLLDASDGKFFIGVRAEHILLHQEKPAGFHLTARVDMIEALGHEFIVFVKVSAADDEFSCRLSELPAFTERQTVYLTWAEEKMHVFSHDSGQRVTVVSKT